MAKMQPLKAASAKNYYFEKDQITNPEGTGNNLSIKGNLAIGLGLTEGESPSQEEFENLLKGFTPDGETQLLDRTKHSATKEENAAFDLITDMPKSASILALEDPRIFAAFKEANEEHMDMIHEKYGKVRQKVEGESIVKDSSGMLSATAYHSVARDENKGISDMHFHAHNLIFNIAHNPDNDKFVSLDARELMKDNGQLTDEFRARFAQKVEALGYAVEIQKVGNNPDNDSKKNSTAWDIVGVDRKEIEHFSQRNQAINSNEGATAQERDQLRHVDKKDKGTETAQELKENWDKQQEEKFGRSFSEMKEHALAIGAKINSSKEKFEDVKEVLEKSMNALTENEALVSEKQLQKLATTLSIGQFNAEEIKEGINDIKTKGQKEDHEVKALNTEDGKMFTTLNDWKTERENVYLAKNQNNSEALMGIKEAQEQIPVFNEKKGFNLSKGQEEAVVAMLTNDKELLILNGNAGTGKTTIMEGFNDAVKDREDVAVIGLAPTGAAAKELEADSGIKAMTIDSFLLKVENGMLDKEEYAGKRLEIIIDEAGMLGGHKANDLLNAAKSHDQDVHITLVGDEKQFKSVNSMDFFSDMNRLENIQKVDLTEANRFKTELTQEVSNLVNDKKVDQALEVINKTGGVITVDLDKDKKVSEETKLELSQIEKTPREGRSISEEDSFSKAKNIGEERNKLKAELSKSKDNNGELDKAYRDKQQEFFNVNIVARDGFSEDSVKSFAASMENKAGETFVKNSIKNADRLVDAGILNKPDDNGNRSFTDSKAKEILNDFADKSNEKIATENLLQHKLHAEQNPDKQQEIILKHEEKELIKEEAKKDEVAFTRNEQLAKAAVNEANGDINIPILAATNKQVDAVNEEGRKSFGLADKENQLNAEVLRPKEKFTDSNVKAVAANFDIGDVIQNNEGVKGMRKFTDYEVKEIKTDTNELVLSTTVKANKKDLNSLESYTAKSSVDRADTEEKTITINAKDLIKSSVSTKEDKDFVEGDKIVILRNNKQLDISNGNVGFVEKVDHEQKVLTVNFGEDSKTGKDKIVDIDLKEFNNLNHGIGLTVNKSQGATYKEAIVIMDSENALQNNSNLALVALTRSKENITVITDNLDAVQEQVKTEQTKTTTLGHEDVKDPIVEDNKLSKEESIEKIQEAVIELKEESAVVNNVNLEEMKDIDTSEATLGTVSEERNGIDTSEATQGTAAGDRIEEIEVRTT